MIRRDRLPLPAIAAQAIAVLGIAALAAGLAPWAAASPAGAAAAPETRSVPAAAILESILLAPQLIDYEGTKIISTARGESIETVTVLEAHKRPNKTRLEYLSPEALVGRLVIDNGVESWHYEPSLHMAFQGPSLSPAAPSGRAAAALQQAYRVEILGLEEVIGRPTFMVSLTARHGGTRRLLWVDQATGLPLRTEERGPEGPRYASYFTRISFSLNLPEALFRFRAPAGARTFSLFAVEERLIPLEQVERAVGFSVRRPAALPAGWRFEGAAVARYGPVAAAHLRYTDGASMLSVFQVPARRTTEPRGGRLVRHGGRTIRVIELGYFRALTWTEGATRLTLVGPHPLPVMLDLATRLGGGG